MWLVVYDCPVLHCRRCYMRDRKLCRLVVFPPPSELLPRALFVLTTRAYSVPFICRRSILSLCSRHLCHRLPLSLFPCASLSTVSRLCLLLVSLVRVPTLSIGVALGARTVHGFGAWNLTGTRCVESSATLALLDRSSAWKGHCRPALVKETKFCVRWFLLEIYNPARWVLAKFCFCGPYLDWCGATYSLALVFHHVVGDWDSAFKRPDVQWYMRYDRWCRFGRFIHHSVVFL